MSGKIIIELTSAKEARIVSELKEQELYQAYVALTAHIASQLRNVEGIVHLSNTATKDALEMIKNKYRDSD